MKTPVFSVEGAEVMSAEPTHIVSKDAHRGQMIVVLLLSIAVTVLLYYVPYGPVIGRPLILFSTFAHEMGHGLAALLVGGDFLNFKMWLDASGVATTAVPDTRLSRAAVSTGGLIGPALLSTVIFALATKPRWARWVLGGFGVLCALSVILVVRNLFGIVFVLGCALSMITIAKFASHRIAHFVLVFLGTQLALSVFSRADYLFSATARTSQGDFPSDVANIADALFLPYWFWGGLIALLSGCLLWVGCWLYYRALDT